MKDGVIAVVAGKEIKQEEFDLFVENLPQDRKAYLQYPGFKERLLDQYLALYTFSADAVEQGLDKTEEFARILENTRRDILAQLAMREAVKNVKVTEEEAKEYYEANPKKCKKEETVQAKHILVEDEDKCTDILNSIVSGEISFEEAAKQHSTCPSGQQGGDLGEFGHGQMVKEFDEAAFAAEPGKVVGPVKTQFGYHLIRVEKKNEAEVQPFEAVKATIVNTLFQKKQNDTYEAKEKELKEKYVEM